jgi:hypothetical protein
MEDVAASCNYVRIAVKTNCAIGFAIILDTSAQSFCKVTSAQLVGIVQSSIASFVSGGSKQHRASRAQVLFGK